MKQSKKQSKSEIEQLNRVKRSIILKTELVEFLDSPLPPLTSVGFGGIPYIYLGRGNPANCLSHRYNLSRKDIYKISLHDNDIHIETGYWAGDSPDSHYFIEDRMEKDVDQFLLQLNTTKLELFSVHTFNCIEYVYVGEGSVVNPIGVKYNIPAWELWGFDHIRKSFHTTWDDTSSEVSHFVTKEFYEKNRDKFVISPKELLIEFRDNMVKKHSVIPVESVIEELNKIISKINKE